MKIQELRIGNKVHFNGNHKEVGTITAISKEQIGRLDMVYINDRIDQYYLMEHIEGIEITGKLLLDAGFVDVDWAGGVYLKDGLFWDEDDSEIGFEKQWFPNKCLYVHQLQNLYFALTQKELTINE